VLRRLIVLLTALASGCLTPALVHAQGIPARAFAYDTAAARLDSMVARIHRDSSVRLTRNGPAVIVLTGSRRHLADSLPAWCRTPCVWEWDELIPAPVDSTPTATDLSAPLSLTWGVGAIGAPAAWAMGARGQGVKVASLDSGIDPNHPGYIVGGGYNAITNLPSGYQDDIGACNGHGTHVGGTMADTTGRGVAPGSLLYGLKVFELIDGQCLAYTSRQVAALDWAGLNGIRCVNISIGGSSSMSYPYFIATARSRGVLIVGANGNTGGPALYPSAYPGVVGVASIGGSGQRSGFSSYGPTTDLAAPGEGIESTMPGGGYGGKSGTSMAAPHVTGACALVLSEDPSLSPDAVESLLKQTADPIGSPTPNDHTGYGRVRPDRAIAALRGGLAIAAPVIDTILPTDALVPVCKPVVALGSWTATSSAPWLRVTTTSDSLCYAIDPALLPSGSATVTGTITTRSTP
jgi:subtilisin